MTLLPFPDRSVTASASLAVLRVLSALTLACSIGVAAQTQGNPANQVRLVIPVPAGGGTDVMGRLIGQKLGELTQQTIVIENRAGAAGNIGTDFVAKSKPDGNTLLFTGMSQVTAHALYDSLPFDPLKDLTPITTLAGYPHALVVSAGFPAKNVAELIAMAKANPGKLTYASAGAGSQYYLAAELFKDVAKVDIQHIPFKGGAPAVTAVMGGHVDMAFANLVQVMPQIKAGTLRAFAISSARRLESAPDIPTFAEAGLPGYEFIAYAVVYGPGGMAPDTVKRINADIAKVVQSKEIKSRLSADGGEAIGNTPDEFKALQQSEADKWTRLIKKLGLKSD